MKNKNVFIKTNLITNFKPTTLDIFNNFILLKQNKKKQTSKNTDENNTNRIYCKNFIIYLLLMKYKNNFFFEKSNIFIKKFKKKIFTILRAPYRHKLTRHQISLNRYEINSSIKLQFKKPIPIKNWKSFLILFNFLKSFNKIFESNIIYVGSINISFPITYEKNFNINFIINKNK